MKMKGDGAWCQCQLSNRQKGFYDRWWGSAFSLTRLRLHSRWLHLRTPARGRKSYARARMSSVLAVWFCIWLQRRVPASLQNFHVCLEGLVKIHPCEIQAQTQSAFHAGLNCVWNERNGAKRADLIYHAFKDAKDKTDKQGLDKVGGWIGCSRQWHGAYEW